MEINNLLGMDGNIVIGIVNERLRLECCSMDELVSRYELDQDELTEKWHKWGINTILLPINFAKSVIRNIITLVNRNLNIRA